jgi:diguanylate cyclase (GGDEF)-like protein/PAS domain S-box-containing protein
LSGWRSAIFSGVVDSQVAETSIGTADLTRIPAALWRSEALFRAISDASPLGIFVSNAVGECVYTNAAYHKISGLTFDQALGTNWSKAIHPEDRQRVVAEWRDAARDRELFQAEVRFLREDQSVVWTRLNARAMRDGDGLHGYVQTVEDITERMMVDAVLRAAEESLYEEKERAQVTLDSIGDAVATTDPAGKVSYLNLMAERMTGWSRDDAFGQPLADVFRIIDGTTRDTATNPAERAIAENRTVGLAAEFVLVRRDGVEYAIEDSAAPIHDRKGRVTGAVIVFHDVSESRAMAEKMAYMAQHDFLTGLANRALLTERLARAIGQAKRHKKQVALLFVDLDDFKRINDSMGHTVGDQLLKLVADRLVACVRSTDTVCRQGGDEFVILLAEVEQLQDAANVADKLLAALVVPQQVGEHELNVTLSIGISVYPDDSRDVDAVMQNADTAMYQAKASGRNNYKFFRDDMVTPGVRRMFVE